MTWNWCSRSTDSSWGCFTKKRKEKFYARCVGLAKDRPYRLKPPLFSSKKVTSRKGKELWTKGPEWNMPIRKKKSISISHTQHRTTSIPIPIIPKRKNGHMRKKKRPTPGARKSKQRDKKQEEVKRKLIY